MLHVARSRSTFLLTYQKTQHASSLLIQRVAKESRFNLKFISSRSIPLRFLLLASPILVDSRHKSIFNFSNSETLHDEETTLRSTQPTEEFSLLSGMIKNLVCSIFVRFQSSDFSLINQKLSFSIFLLFFFYFIF